MRKRLEEMNDAELQEELEKSNYITNKQEPNLSTNSDEPKPTNESKPTLQSVTSEATTLSRLNEPPKRTSSKQRKASLEEYKELFLTTPKIVDRQPVFISRDLRDRIDEIARRLGERKMSVSGFLENLSRHHLDNYIDELEKWKRL